MKYIILILSTILIGTCVSAQDGDAVFMVKAVKHLTFSPDTSFITTYKASRFVLSNIPPGIVSVSFSKGKATIKDSLLVIIPEVQYTSFKRASMEKFPKDKNPMSKLVLDEGVLSIIFDASDGKTSDTFTRKFYITIPPTIQLFDIASANLSIHVGDRNLTTKSYTFRAHNADVFKGFEKSFNYVDSTSGIFTPIAYGAIELKARTIKGDQKIQCKGSTLTKDMLDVLMTERGDAQYGIQLYPILSNGKIDENIFDLIYVNFDNMANISVQTTRKN